VVRPPVATPSPTESEPPATRQVPAAALPEVLSPRQGSVAAPGGVEIRWTDVPRSLYYEVQLTTDEGSLVWEGRSELSSLRLPAGVSLLPGRTYYVSVRAYLPEGKSLKSPVVGFQVAAGN